MMEQMEVCMHTLFPRELLITIVTSERSVVWFVNITCVHLKTRLAIEDFGWIAQLASKSIFARVIEHVSL